MDLYLKRYYVQSHVMNWNCISQFLKNNQVPVETPRLACQKNFNLLRIFKLKNQYVISCIADLKSHSLIATEG